MKIGFLFPGQGSQNIGMGKDIYDKYEEARDVYEKVKRLTNIDIAKITFEEDEKTLNQTKNTQISILTMSLAILEILKKERIRSDIVAGLSLGEYSALIYSGAITFDDGVKIVKKRGQYMQELVPEGEWAMAAIIGLEDEKVEKICNGITNGFVVPANYNCPGQIAISGEKRAVEEAAENAKKLGAKKVITLRVQGPFHTEKLIDSSKALKQELKNIKIHRFNAQVIKNIDGIPYSRHDDIIDILAKHIVKPVRFSKSLESMINMGVDTFIEIGPGKILSGFVKRIKTDKQINILNINNVDSLEQAINFIKKEGNV